MKKTILVTGASSGIGEAAARHFTKNDWNVIATMREPANSPFPTDTPDLLVTRLNVEDLPSIREAIEQGIAHFGKIDVLLNNAGYGQYGLFEAIPREKVMQQFDVNVFGVMDVTRAVLPHFRNNRRGIILNVSSGAGIYTLPKISLYCASKFALEGFSEALSYELSSLNIAVKIIEPHGGVTSTRFVERSEADHASDPALSDYHEFDKHAGEAFARMASARTTTSEEVAQVIYEAATDGTDRLRYLVGNDTRGFIKARRELPEHEYVEFMRSHFKR